MTLQILRRISLFRPQLFYSSTSAVKMSAEEYQRKSESALQSILDQMEELQEAHPQRISDVEYSSGVLTVAITDPKAEDSRPLTYVLNKQPPNLQIWLSSPISGPKRYDYVSGSWLYKKDGESIHSLISKELSHILSRPIHIKSH